MGIFKSLFSKPYREEYSTEISMRINSEQEEYHTLYSSLLSNDKADSEKTNNDDSLK